MGARTRRGMAVPSLASVRRMGAGAASAGVRGSMAGVAGLRGVGVAGLRGAGAAAYAARGRPPPLSGRAMLA